MNDYLRAYGQDAVAGINYVGASVTLNEAALGTLIGRGLLENMEGAVSADLPTSIQAMRTFLKSCLVKPISQEDFEVALAYNVIVPSEVRAALAAREIDADDVMSALRVPVLVTHGLEDVAMLPAMGEHILETCPSATASWYEGVGHVPFMEAAARFNKELAAFVKQVQG